MDGKMWPGPGVLRPLKTNGCWLAFIFGAREDDENKGAPEMNAIPTPIDQAAEQLHSAGWSIGATATADG
jgi:hypothetical protein